MQVNKDPILRTYSIVGLDSDQLAYITALVGLSNSQANAEGVSSSNPLMPTAGKLFSPLWVACQNHALHAAVEAATHAQDMWKLKQKRPHTKGRAA